VSRSTVPGAVSAFQPLLDGLDLAGVVVTADGLHPRRRGRVGHGHDHTRWAGSPTCFLTDRAEAERALQLAERLGSVNAAAAELDTTWPSLGKAFTRHGLGIPPATRRQSASERSSPPARAPASRPPPAWTRCLPPSTQAPFPAGGRTVCVGPSRRSTPPPWAPMSWLSSTAKVGPPFHHPSLVDHPPRRPQPAAG
jgi:hypothetical protein